MHSRNNPPARRSNMFDAAAMMSMESLLRAAQRIPTRDTRWNDLEIALRIECCTPNRVLLTSDMDRDWDDGWLHGIALAARTVYDRRRETNMLSARHGQ